MCSALLDRLPERRPVANSAWAVRFKSIGWAPPSRGPDLLPRPLCFVWPAWPSKHRTWRGLLPKASGPFVNRRRKTIRRAHRIIALFVTPSSPAQDVIGPIIWTSSIDSRGSSAGFFSPTIAGWTTNFRLSPPDPVTAG